MATSLNCVFRGCRNGWVLLLLSAIPGICSAQALLDPTRPPDDVSVRPETNELQSIIISPTRRAAIIHGQTVELGGKVGDVRLIEVNESGVVLQGENGLEVLPLFPGVKINRKTIALPMEDGAEHPARKAERVNKPASQAGKKEEK